MVCLMCLIPLFLVPIVNVLPLLFDFIMAKIYRLFGKDYRKPARVPPSCPYKPSATKLNNSVSEEPSPVDQGPLSASTRVDDVKRE